MATVAEQAVWITVPEARRRLAIGRPAFDKLTRQGKLTVRTVPGSWSRVRADEVDRLAESSTKRAHA